MTTYAIHEDNIERLEKKLTTIANKCKRYGLDFHYERVGEELREVKTEDMEEPLVQRYILVEAEGKAIVNNWEFVATLEHTEKGNIISGYGEHEVPERYYNAEPVCEHCNSKRKRSNTYIIFNTETEEFKQVGKSCLKDFTMGLDAEMVTAYISGFDELIKGEIPYSGCYSAKYFNIEEMLCYFNETIKHFGYVRSQDFEQSTASRASDYFEINHGRTTFMTQAYLRKCREEMEKVNFNPDTEENHTKAKAMIAWVLTNENNGNYFHNLKVVCSHKHISSENFGLVASIPATYDKNLEIEAEKRRREEEAKRDETNSQYVGKVGERITFKVADARILSSRSNEWGETFFIKFRGEDGNIYMWSTSNANAIYAPAIKATVKGYNEYNGIKQTVITRGNLLDNDGKTIKYVWFDKNDELRFSY